MQTGSVTQNRGGECSDHFSTLADEEDVWKVFTGALWRTGSSSRTLPDPGHVGGGRQGNSTQTHCEGTTEQLPIIALTKEKKAGGGGRGRGGGGGGSNILILGGV